MNVPTRDPDIPVSKTMHYLPKFFMTLILVTALAVLYVGQQAAGVKLGYQITAQEETLSEMLDQRQMMLYNVCSEKSPLKLRGEFINDGRDFKVLNGSQIIILAEAVK